MFIIFLLIFDYWSGNVAKRRETLKYGTFGCKKFGFRAMSQRILKLCVASLLNILCFPGTGVATTLKIVQWPTQCGLPALRLANSDKSGRTYRSIFRLVYFLLSISVRSLWRQPDGCCCLALPPNDFHTTGSSQALPFTDYKSNGTCR